MICLFISCNSYQRISYEDTANEATEAYRLQIEKYKGANKRILYDTYMKYVQAADFVDSSGHVTEESIWAFKELFESGAKIVNDIQLFPETGQEMIDAEYYADLVSTYMNRKGIVTKFDEIDINTFFSGTGDQFQPRVDDADQDDSIFFYTYETIKRNYNILNKHNQVLNYNEAIEYPIIITFRISIKNQSADIVSILPKKIKKP